MDMPADADIIRYHEETKHHFHRFARSAGHMDWENQPDPFRFYSGQAPVFLPLLGADPSSSYWDLYDRKKRPSTGFSLENIAGFLELSLALSAWKSAAGSKWSLRINPSSGNLHPTEAYLITYSENNFQRGVYHYSPFWHALERRAAISSGVGDLLKAHFNTAGFLIGLSSIFWRESWKYGERAFRYCNHDVGHALACLSFSANIFGWTVKCLNAVSDADIGTVLGMHQTVYPQLEEEHPDILCVVYPNEVEEVPRALTGGIVSEFKRLTFTGKPNRLSQKPVNWSRIYRAAKLSLKPETAERRYTYGQPGFFKSPTPELTAAQIIRSRRSATDFDPAGFVDRNQFLAMLDKTIPRRGTPPFDVELGPAAAHLLIFVHRVTGLQPGLYGFFRSFEDIAAIKQSLRPGLAWECIEKDFPLYRLETKDYRREAKIVSCDQEIAGAGAFSMGMVASFKDHVRQAPYRYRRLFWETGMVGQVLYLEAEAHAARGTGIGCYFDDEVHRIAGIRDNRYQSLYHFTVGKPLEDPRLTTHPPYHHLKDSAR